MGSEGQQSVSGDQVGVSTVCAENDELSEFCDFSDKECGPPGLDFFSVCPSFLHSLTAPRQIKALEALES